MTRLIFGREPAYWLALVSGLVAFVSAAVFPLNTEQQGVVNAAAAALVGLITAGVLAGEKSVAAIVGFGKALIAVGLAFGLSWSPEVQSTTMVLVELVLTGVLVRPNVEPKVKAAYDDFTPAAVRNSDRDVCHPRRSRAADRPRRCSAADRPAAGSGQRRAGHETSLWHDARRSC